MCAFNALRHFRFLQLLAQITVSHTNVADVVLHVTA